MAGERDDSSPATVKTLPSPRPAGAAATPQPPMLVRLAAADDLRPPSARFWLDGCDEVRIFRGKAAGVRASDRSLSISLDDGYASSRHATLRRSGDGFFVGDHGSTNGTFVDGRQLQPGEERLLRSGVVEVGHTFFFLRAATNGAGDSPAAQSGEPLTFHARFAQDLSAAARLARSSHDLLVTGETGSGKEVVSRWLHHASGRPGPLVAVNCGALAEHLLDDELFGHVKGAFSGAHDDRQGLIRAAHRGTLLLDEVGDMPAALQVKVLRVLEERRVRPLGSEREVAVDLQVIAATHRDLPSLVAQGKFRQDLLARLGLLPVRVPPLRERREDLGLVLRAILREIPRGLERVRFELEALRDLFLREWPMNVRELRRFVLAAIDLAGGDGETVLILRRHLPAAAAGAPTPPAQAELSAEDRELQSSIRALLQRHRGNVAAVAREMGKPRTHVQRLMARLRIARTGP